MQELERGKSKSMTLSFLVLEVKLLIKAFGCNLLVRASLEQVSNSELIQNW